MHRRERRIDGRHAADDVADRVDADVEAEILHPRHDEIAAGTVVVGERQAGAAAALDGADLRQIGEPPQRRSDVDVHRVLHRSLQFVKEARIDAKASV